jgi:hydrogenase maturation protein HypF
MALLGVRIHITGIVQGVGFRPFVYGLAVRWALKGWVRNSSAGVDIEVDGTQGDLQAFIDALQSEAPPLARIDSLQVEWLPAVNFSTFEIVHSDGKSGDFVPISPDVSICPDCLQEMLDPSNRRYRYPFINCTNCGPRFTIIKDIPYDRPKTTMGHFELCPACQAEYDDPLDRRFHAQPVACPDCGPHIWLESLAEQKRVIANKEFAVQAARKSLAAGKTLAIKGLGGFHLACDATNTSAVDELRRRKLRVDKPFALMMPSLEVVLEHCFISPAEQEQLLSRQRPIVLLR